jgi:hypothetical protein
MRMWARSRGRLAIALVVVGAAVAATAWPARAQNPPGGVAVKDAAEDVRGPLDLVRVALVRGSDGRLRAELTMADPWGVPELRAAAGPSGTVCLQVWTRRTPGEQPPDYLACLTPPAQGDVFTGRVLRDRANGLPRTVGPADVSRPTPRTVYMRFAQSMIGRPDELRFAAEAASRVDGCPRPLGCRDTAPGAPATAGLRLRGAPPEPVTTPAPAPPR